MDTEFEATFLNINKDEVRARLKKAGAKLIYPEFLQTRAVFNLPKGHEIKGGWLRVRQEFDKITMSLKVVAGGKIEDQKEICLKVDNFEKAVELLESIGCEKKSFQESKREKWDLRGAEVVIDKWPYVEPYVEIEAESEEKVKAVSRELGFDYTKAYFGSLDGIVAQKYGISCDRINNHTPLITFAGKNPFV